MWQDVRQAARVMRKNPGFTVVAVMTLGLGIGANTAIFSVVNGVLLEPPRYADANRIVTFETRFPEQGRAMPRVTGGDLVDLRGANRIFEAFSVFRGGEMGVQLREKAEFTGVYLVNSGFFRVFGVMPVYGRLFQDGEAHRAAVVSASFANRNLGGGAAALGKRIHVESWDLEVVGVVAGGLQYPQPTEVWICDTFTPESLNRTAYNYRAVAKLKEGVTLALAQVRMKTIGARLRAAFPASNRDKTFGVMPLREQLVGPVRTMLYFLLGAVSLVLLIACANVANLLLARAAARGREFAVRAALGAGRRRIARQLFVENLLLGLTGGAAGAALAWLSLDGLLRLAPNLPRMSEAEVSPAVLLFTLVVSAGASLLFGLAPAVQAGRMDIQEALKQGGGRGLVGGRGNGVRKALVVAEVALAVVLAIGAGLLMRSFFQLRTAELGYRPEGMLVMYAHAPAKGLEGYIAAAKRFEELLSRLETIPGVKAAAAAMGLPAGRYGSNGAYAVEGKHRFEAGQKLPEAGFRLASPKYFSAMGIPLLRGREFGERDQWDTPFVAIVSESLVKQVFPDEDPIGRRIQCGLDSPKWMTVVGVVGDVRQESPASRPGPELYMPLAQHPYHANEVQVVVRTSGPPGALIGAVRSRAREWNPEVAVKFTTLEEMVAGSVATPRFRTLLVGAFAGLALLLAMAGVYGVVSYLVTQRKAEFGLRMALGAEPWDVLRLVLGETMGLAVAGVAVGVALSFAFHGVVKTMLFGVAAADAMTYAAVVGCVCGITMAAAWIPARRAMGASPVEALREE